MDNRYHTILIPLTAALLLAAALAAPAAAAESFGERLRGLFGERRPDPGTDAILPAEEAFRFSAAAAGPDRLSLFWQIADGYYLYRDKFAFEIRRGDVSIRRDAVVIPPGRLKRDENFGEVRVITGEVSVELPLLRSGTRGAVPVVVHVAYQGCKEDAVCYPPVQKDIPVTLSAVPEQQ